MTLSLPASHKTGALTLALAYAALTIGGAVSPAPAEARSTNPHYVAQLVQPTDKTVEILRGTPWTCDGTVCTAPKTGSRALTVCRNFVRKIGEVSSFTVKGEELAADEMAKCQPA